MKRYKPILLKIFTNYIDVIDASLKFDVVNQIFKKADDNLLKVLELFDSNEEILNNFENYALKNVKDKNFYIYGAGECGKLFFDLWCRKNKKFPENVLDKYCKDFSFFSPVKGKNVFNNFQGINKCFPVILTVYRTDLKNKIYEELKDIGFKEIIQIPQEFWEALYLKKLIIEYLIDKALVALNLGKNLVNKQYLGIRLDLLGDFFIFFPFFLEYINNFQDHLFLINNLHKDIVKHFTSNYFVINVDKFSLDFNYRKKVFSFLSGYYFKNAINFVTYRYPLICDQIIITCESNNKICYIADHINKRSFLFYDVIMKFLNIFYNIKIPQEKDYKLNNKDLYSHVWFHESNFYSYFSNKKIKDIKNFYFNAFAKLKDKLNKKIDTKYICIITDASLEYKRYPQKKWQEILNNLPEHIKIIQLGLRNIQLGHPNLINLTGKTSLEEAMALVLNASLVIGNDTGLTHLAYLSGVPTVFIIGGGHWGRFFPWKEFEDLVKWVCCYMDCFGCGWLCKYKNNMNNIYPCIENIEVDCILTAIDELNSIYKIF